MAVKMRLIRMGKKKSPTYRVVVVDGRSPRDGRYIDQIGRYDPRQDPSLVEIDNEKASEWLRKGAQPTEAVEKLLNISGALSTMKVQRGQIHTVSAAAQAEAQAEEPEVELAPTHEEAAAARAESTAAPVEDEPASAGEPSPEAIAADVSSEEE